MKSKLFEQPGLEEMNVVENQNLKDKGDNKKSVSSAGIIIFLIFL